MSKQDDVNSFINDTDNLSKAVEGSMEKRQAVMDNQTSSYSDELTKILEAVYGCGRNSRLKLSDSEQLDTWMSVDQAEAAIQAHTNAEIAKVLDRLQHELDGGRTYTSVSLIEDAIQAERAKLNEVK